MTSYQWTPIHAIYKGSAGSFAMPPPPPLPRFPCGIGIAQSVCCRELAADAGSPVCSTLERATEQVKVISCNTDFATGGVFEVRCSGASPAPWQLLAPPTSPPLVRTLSAQGYCDFTCAPYNLAFVHCVYNPPPAPPPPLPPPPPPSPPPAAPPVPPTLPSPPPRPPPPWPPPLLCSSLAGRTKVPDPAPHIPGDCGSLPSPASDCDQYYAADTSAPGAFHLCQHPRPQDTVRCGTNPGLIQGCVPPPSPPPSPPSPPSPPPPSPPPSSPPPPSPPLPPPPLPPPSPPSPLPSPPPVSPLLTEAAGWGAWHLPGGRQGRCLVSFGPADSGPANGSPPSPPLRPEPVAWPVVDLHHMDALHCRAGCARRPACVAYEVTPAKDSPVASHRFDCRLFHTPLVVAAVVPQATPRRTSATPRHHLVMASRVPQGVSESRRGGGAVCYVRHMLPSPPPSPPPPLPPPSPPQPSIVAAAASGTLALLAGWPPRVRVARGAK